jgi:hypothetical protein
MKSTVFSAVVVYIGYTLLGWDFTIMLGIHFFVLVSICPSNRKLGFHLMVLSVIFIIWQRLIFFSLFCEVTEANLHMKKEFELVNGTCINTMTIAVSICGAIVITIFSRSLLDFGLTDVLYRFSHLCYYFSAVFWCYGLLTSIFYF